MDLNVLPPTDKENIENEIVPIKKKRERPKLTSDMLKENLNLFDNFYKSIPDYQKGKDDFLIQMITQYEMFCKKVFPKISTDDFIARAERLGSNQALSDTLYMDAFGKERKRKNEARLEIEEGEDRYENENEDINVRQSRNKRQRDPEPEIIQDEEEEVERVRESSPDIYEDDIVENKKPNNGGRLFKNNTMTSKSINNRVEEDDIVLDDGEDDIILGDIENKDVPLSPSDKLVIEDESEIDKEKIKETVLSEEEEPVEQKIMEEESPVKEKKPKKKKEKRTKSKRETSKRKKETSNASDDKKKKSKSTIEERKPKKLVKKSNTKKNLEEDMDEIDLHLDEANIDEEIEINLDSEIEVNLEKETILDKKTEAGPDSELVVNLDNNIESSMNIDFESELVVDLDNEQDSVEKSKDEETKQFESKPKVEVNEESLKVCRKTFQEMINRRREDEIDRADFEEEVKKKASIDLNENELNSILEIMESEGLLMYENITKKIFISN